jgi:hypothetical protein
MSGKALSRQSSNDVAAIQELLYLNAAFCGSEKCLRFFLASGAPKNVVRELVRNALLCAAEKGHPGCLEILCEAQVDLEARHAKNDETALICAAKNGHEACAKVLISAGADTNASSSGKNGLVYALDGRHVKCINLLAELAGTESLSAAAAYIAEHTEMAEAIQALLSNQSEYDAETVDGSEPEDDKASNEDTEERLNDAARMNLANLLAEIGPEAEKNNDRDKAADGASLQPSAMKSGGNSQGPAKRVGFA